MNGTYRPRSARTGKHYRKRTRLALAAAVAEEYAERGDSLSPWWGTYSTWTATGARVRRGERAVVVTQDRGRSICLFNESQLCKPPKRKDWDKLINDSNDPAVRAAAQRERAKMKEINEYLRARSQLAGATACDDQAVAVVAADEDYFRNWR